VEVGTVVGLDGMEDVKTAPFEDASSCLADPLCLRSMADRDGFLFVRGLLPADLVLALREAVLEFASGAGWLDAVAPAADARAAPGRRIGDYHDPDWVRLQAHVQTRSEMWAVGDAAAIHRTLRALDGRASYLFLSTANTCRVFSPHPEMATRPHQDAFYVRMIADFWTAWLPLGDCPRELGGLAVLAGSHRGGLLDHSGLGIDGGGVRVPDEAVWSTADFACGDVVFFRPYTLHRALPNRSGTRLRLSADFRYGFWEETSPVDWRAQSIGR
jgi:ectoine hydroxylase-related dioxygenase (phytanoyl-CoA dioxygenase family)